MTNSNPFLQVPHLTQLLQAKFGPTAQALEATPYDIDNSASILVTLTAQQSDAIIGHFGIEVRWQLGSEERLDHLVLKVKPHGAEIADMLSGLAQLSDPELGKVYALHANETGFANTHLREVEVYSKLVHAIQPKVAGFALDATLNHYQVLLEDLSGSPHLNSVMSVREWTDGQLQRALSDLAQWHNFARDKVNLLNAQAWADTDSPGYWQQQAGLWRVLLDKGYERFPQYYAPGLYEAMRRGLGQVEALERQLSKLPKTLIHNDANPRNSCFREDGSFCLYDWELACVQVPVYDVVELLSFVIEANRYDKFESFIAGYREVLQQHWPAWKDDEMWRQSLHLAWYVFGWHRLGMYSMAHAVAPYPFLPRVFETYRALGRYLGLVS